MGPGRSESRSGGPRYHQNWLLDSLDGGLEGPGTVKTAILGPQEAVWAPFWGHLEASGGCFWGILGSQTSPERYFLGFELEM